MRLWRQTRSQEKLCPTPYCRLSHVPRCKTCVAGVFRTRNGDALPSMCCCIQAIGTSVVSILGHDMQGYTHPLSTSPNSRAPHRGHALGISGSLAIVHLSVCRIPSFVSISWRVVHGSPVQPEYRARWRARGTQQFRPMWNSSSDRKRDR